VLFGLLIAGDVTNARAAEYPPPFRLKDHPMNAGRLLTRFGWLLTVFFMLSTASPAAEPWEYETGGPLAGVKLPPFPTPHGEPAGQPGVLPEPGDPVLRLDFGELEPGMYCVRMIGAVPTEELRPFLLPVFVEMIVNDGLQGETSRHRLRIGYQDEFYSVASVEDTTFALSGPPVEQQDFGPENALRLWEYGVGDQVRMSTSVSLRRVKPGAFEIRTDVAAKISPPARRLTILRDGMPLPVDPRRSADGWLRFELPATDAPLRVETE
jgi:hypothetical protein